MSGFGSALWTEALKSRRSRVPLLVSLGFCMAPLTGGLFMIILKNPEAAKSMGLISAKAQITVGTADWPAYFSMLGQAVAIGGYILFSILTAWVFGREFSDRTVKELLALPTRREEIVLAKFLVILAWAAGMSVLIFGVGLLVGFLVDIPDWSTALLADSAVSTLGAAALTLGLLPFVGLAASAGRGYLPAFGWAVLTMVLAQIAGALGRGDWFPWTVPALFTGMAGPRAEQLGPHSYVLLLLAAAAGLAGTLIWWRRADQAK
ncbi:MAG TPA: ABC transporter permease [Anaerolineales bacterium]